MSEARLLDMASTMFYLSDLESEEGRRYWNTDEKESAITLQKLRDLGIIDVAYWFDRMTNLSRIFLRISGQENNVCSATYSILKNTPTSSARLNEDGKTSLILARVPTASRDEFVREFQECARNSRLLVECWYPSAQRNYQVDLYQRLLEQDGWNSDITAFLSQIRSIPKSLLEEVKSEFG